MALTPPIVILKKGALTLDLNSGRYRVDDNWSPPPVGMTPLYTEPGSLNRYGGGSLIGRRGDNRQTTLPVSINGATEAEVSRGARDLQAFLNLAGDDDDPLTLSYRPNSDTGSVEPYWGNYGTNLNYEVVYGLVKPPALYGAFNLRNTALPGCEAVLTVKPFALGARQWLANATGGILEDVIGVTDGQSRGVIIPEATTNLFTNPAFTHASPANGWTMGNKFENHDPRFTLFRGVSFECTPITATELYTQSITLAASAHTVSAYIKLPDAGVPTSSDCQLHYNASDLTTVFTSVGNGFYRITATATGTGIAAVCGLHVKTGRKVYLCGMQAEALAYATPMCYGDLFGCAWTGTAHASTSTRTAGKLNIGASGAFGLQYPIPFGQGTLRFAWKAPFANTHPNDMQLFQFGNSGFAGKFNAAGDTFTFSDATNTATSAAQTFSAGDVLVFHFVYSGAGGLVIYKNGLSIATAGTYTDTNYGGSTGIWIGSKSDATLSAHGPFMGLDLYDVALSAAQVLADYTNAAAVLADGQRLSSIPYYWTQDGEGIIQNGTDSALDNYAIIGGIPGSVPALTELQAALSSGWSTIQTVALGNFAREYGDHIPVSRFLFHDQGGTVDAAMVGGQTLTTGSLNTTETTIGSVNLTFEAMRQLAGHEFWPMVRLNDAGANLTARLTYQMALSVGAIIGPALLPITTTAAYRLFRLTLLSLPTLGSLFYQTFIYDFLPSPLSLLLRGKRSTAGAANVLVDYFSLLPRPAVFIGDSSVVTTHTGLMYRSTGRARAYDATLGPSDSLPVIGDALELTPERYNILSGLLGNTGVNPVITYTLTLNAIKVTPRWSLL